MMMTVTCSFCGQNNLSPKVRQMVRADGDVAICDVCIETARDIIGAAREAERSLLDDFQSDVQAAAGGLTQKPME